jgi:mRNA interferase HigB
MHVIAKPISINFWTKHPDAKNPLQAWFRLVTRQAFVDFNALRATFKAADDVEGLTVFNIGGNTHRLIAAIHYNRRKVFSST